MGPASLVGEPDAWPMCVQNREASCSLRTSTSTCLSASSSTGKAGARLRMTRAALALASATAFDTSQLESPLNTANRPMRKRWTQCISSGQKIGSRGNCDLIASLRVKTNQPRRSPIDGLEAGQIDSSARRSDRASLPKPSGPALPTKRTLAPSRAAATAWLAPLPPIAVV